MLLIAGLSASAAPTTLWGFLRSSNNSSPLGVYSFNAEDGMKLNVVNTSAFTDEYYGDEVDANGGGVFQDGKFYFIELYEIMDEYYPLYYALDTVKWTGDLGTETSLDLVANAVTYDATTGLSYGAFLDNNGSRWVIASADYPNQKRTKIADTDSLYTAFAASKDGRIYAISEGNNLYEMNKTTGAMTLIGATGVTAGDYPQSATISKRTGEMFWSVTTKDGKSALYSVNISTGAATKIANFPNNAQLVCLYIPNEDTEEGSPLKVSNLTTSFLGGSLSGSVNFRLPSTDNTGKAISGPLSYYIREDNDTLLRGTGNAGDSITAPLTTTEGTHQFVVTAANDKGSSPVSNVSAYIGYDTPKAPTNVKLSINKNGLATLTWNAVTEGTHGGYVGDITYDVVRYPDSVKVTTTDTRLQEQFTNDVLRAYMYGVRATSHGKTSRQARSNGANVGVYYETPWHDGFDTEADFKLWKIIDNNNDGYTWSYFDGISSNSYAQTSWSYLHDADDWLISPDVHLAIGTYTVSFKAKSTLSNSPERIEVLYGTGNTASYMTDSLFTPIVLDNANAFTTYSTKINITRDGIYNFGFHAISDAGMCRIQLDDISVVRSESTDGINSITSNDERRQSESVYDLSGRLVSRKNNIGAKHLQPGIYIVGGKKIVVR